MVLLDFSVIPLGRGESVSEYVARAVAIVEQSGLDYRVHAMGTTVEGELTEVLDLLHRCISALATDCDRVTVTAKFDCRRGQTGRLSDKVASVEQKLGHPVKK